MFAIWTLRILLCTYRVKSYENGQQQTSAGMRNQLHHARTMSKSTQDQLEIDWARTGTLRYSPHLYRARRQRPGTTYLDYTQDGRKRTAVTAAGDRCECVECNNTEAAFSQGKFENVVYNRPVFSNNVGKSGEPDCAVSNGLLNHGSGIACFHSIDLFPHPYFELLFQTVITFHRFNIIRRNADDEDKYKMLGVTVVVDGRPRYNFPKCSNPERADNLPVVIGIQIPMVSAQIMRVEKDTRAQDCSDNYHLRICSVEIWVCKPGTFGVHPNGCEPCPEECDYTCDNQLGCVAMTHNVAFKKLSAQSHPGKGSSDNLVDGWTVLPRLSDCIRITAAGNERLWIRAETILWFLIYSVTTLARVDCCGPEDLRQFTIEVTSDRDPDRERNPAELCASRQQGVQTKERVELTCTEPLLGRFIWLFTTGVLGFCRFEAFGLRYYHLPAGSTCGGTSKIFGCAEGFSCVENICKALILNPCEQTDCAGRGICDLGLCRLNHNDDCDPVVKACRSGTFCEPGSSKCKINYGDSCAGDKNEYCPSDAICDVLHRCGIPPGGSCAEENKVCSAGAFCENGVCICTVTQDGATVSVLENGRCKPVSGRVGSTCENGDDCNDNTCSEGKCICPENQNTYAEEFSCRYVAGTQCQSDDDCNTGLLCEGSTSSCKLLAGQNCDENNQTCVPGTTCIFRICAINPGQNCTGMEASCTEGSSCIEGKCKLRLDMNCGPYLNNDPCESGLCSTLDSNTCKIPGGQSCEVPNEEKCATGTFCENSAICKIRLGEVCTDTIQCEGRSICTSREEGGEMTCNRALGSFGCEADSDCEQGADCDLQNRCSLPKGASCSKHPDKCLHGGMCVDGVCQCNAEVTITSTEKCEARAGQIGASCSPTNAEGKCALDTAVCSRQGRCVCTDGFVVDPATLRCRIALSSPCGPDSKYTCENRAVCDVGGICELDAGQSCLGDERSECRVGTLCDSDNICRYDIHQSCREHRGSCRLGTICDLLLRCKNTPKSRCNENEECMAGAECSTSDGGNQCQCIEGLTTLDDTNCVPDEGVVFGPCKRGGTCDDSDSFCNTTTTRCQCKQGYTADPRTLACAIKEGVACTTDSNCVMGLVCDAESKECRIKVGQICDGGNERFCASGAICEVDYVCRVDVKGDCSGIENLFCRHGTLCDVLGECNYGVGSFCNASDKDPCIVGAECVEDVCKCDSTITNERGALCEPYAGQIGGSCLPSCTDEHSVCVDGQCQCQEPFKIDRKLKCVGSFEESSKSWLLALLALPFLCLLGLIIVGRVWKRRKERAKTEVMEVRHESMAALRELKKEAEQVEAEEIREADDSEVTQHSTTDTESRTSIMDDNSVDSNLHSEAIDEETDIAVQADFFNSDSKLP